MYAALAATTLAVFVKVRDYPLLDFDDLVYVTDNPNVMEGLTWNAILWAFTHAHEGYWAPLTWMSYMADVDVFGPGAAGFHVTNVLIHTASACLLFAVSRRMTGARWRSALVAALFAVHPLHVEAVAWVAERKEVLSGFFWFATFWAYARYVERPRLRRYLLVVACFVAGLMSKPMIVTLPIVLMLLDVWPLRRPLPFSARLREKAPLFALSAAAAALTIAMQRQAGAVASLDVASPALRLENAVVSYALYLVKTVWPTGLAALYPYQLSIPGWHLVGAILLLLAVSVAVIRLPPRFAFVRVGWLWYLVTLLPVIGIVQAGAQARADRYTYIPMIGLSIIAAWGAAEITTRGPRARRVLAGAMCVVVASCAALSWRQVEYWRSTEAVFRRAIEVTSGNYVARAGLGTVLRPDGRTEEAIGHYREAVRLAPEFAEARGNLGEALLAKNDPVEALPHLDTAVRVKPAVPEFHLHRAAALTRLGRKDEAMAEYRETIRLAPHFADAHYNLATLLARAGGEDEAIRHFSEAACLTPASADSHVNLGQLLLKKGRLPEAIDALQTAVRLRPADPVVRSNLGIALATAGRHDEAIAEFTEAVRLEPEALEFRENLQLALAMRASRRR